MQEISRAQRSIKSRPSRNGNGNGNNLATMMWLTFIVTNLVTIPVSAMGWRLSPHKEGNLEDADFWFLLQSSAMTFLSLLTMAIPMSKGNNMPLVASGQLWFFMAVGGVCAISAPIFYLNFATEWSAFLNIAAGCIQAFATLQVVVTAETVPKQHLRRD